MTYISGPMRGKPRFNFPAFFAEELRLRSLGVKDVYNPARADMVGDHFDPDDASTQQPFEQSHYVLRDVDAIVASEAVVRLRGWRKSTGACAEEGIAIWLDLPRASAPDPLPIFLEQAEVEMQKIREEWKDD